MMRAAGGGPEPVPSGVPVSQVLTLRSRALFLEAAQGPRLSTPAFTMQRRLPRVEKDSGTGLRFGFTTTRKIGNAVERNRIRRRLRAAVRGVLARLPQGPLTLDLVIIARRAALRHPFEALMADIERALLALSRQDRPGRPR